MPLACNPWGSSAFELPKAVALRLLVLALVVLTLRRPAPAGDHTMPRAFASPLSWAAVAYLAAALLATVVSREPRVSLLGSLARQQGLLTLACYPLLFLLTAGSLRTSQQVRRLWQALVWTSAPIVAYGLAQAAGVDPLGWQSDGASPVLSTLGRSNFLGSYLVLVMPLTVALALTARRRWVYALLLLGQAACLAVTHARGSLIGLGAAVVVVAAAMLPWRRLRLPALGIAVGLALAAFAALAAWLPATAGSAAARLTIWRASPGLLATRPLLGYGPETLQTVFYGVFPPQLVYYQGRDVVVDRAHNLWLDLGLSVGLAGLAAFAAVLLLATRAAWRGYAHATRREERIAWLALLAAIAGHIAEQQVSFEVTGTATVFWLTLATVPALARLPGTEPEPHPAPAPMRPVTAWLPPATAAILLAVLTAAIPLAADTYSGLAGTAAAPARRLAWAAAAVRLWPVEPQYRLQLGLLLATTGDLAGADRQVAAAVALRPADPVLWLAQGSTYASWPGDGARLRQAEAAYRQAIALAPNLATLHVALGRALAAQGRLSEASTSLDRAIALDATDHCAHEQLAAVYAASGNGEEAARARADAEYWRARTAPQAVSLAR